MVDRTELLMRGIQPIIVDSILYGVKNYDIYFNALNDMNAKEINQLSYVFANEHESLNYEVMLLTKIFTSLL